MSEIIEIPIAKIKVGEHAQRLKIDEDEIWGLAESIRRIGIVCPLWVAADGDNYLLIAGHRRLAAAQQCGLGTVPCMVRETRGKADSELCFAENFFREDLSPVELAGALKDCLAREVMTVEELSAGFHRSVHWVQSMIAIADWPTDVQEVIHEGGLSVAAGHNLALVTDPGYRNFLVRNAVEQGATARTTASWLQAWRAMQPQEEAITAEPVCGTRPTTPAVPQAPCLCCSQLFEVNQMSHVPVCGACIQIIRQVGTTAG